MGVLNGKRCKRNCNYKKISLNKNDKIKKEYYNKDSIQ